MYCVSSQNVLFYIKNLAGNTLGKYEVGWVWRPRIIRSNWWYCMYWSDCWQPGLLCVKPVSRIVVTLLRSICSEHKFLPSQMVISLWKKWFPHAIDFFSTISCPVRLSLTVGRNLSEENNVINFFFIFHIYLYSIILEYKRCFSKLLLAYDVTTLL